MVNFVAALLALSVGPALLAGSWTVCVLDDASLLNAPIRAAVLHEFHWLMRGHSARLDFDSCPAAAGRVELSIKPEPPDHLPGILGMARRGGDRIEPRLQVFYGPLVRHLGEPNNAGAVGRALARVAAHEAGHFLRQQTHHCKDGLLRAAFPAHELAARDPWPFRYLPHCRAAPKQAPHPGLLADLGARPLAAQPPQRSEPEEESPLIR